MMDLTIREIAEACGGKLVVQGDSADGDSSVSSVVIDSRLVEPGGVFIAVPGERVDGHAFIEGAFARGAILAVTARTPQQVAAEYGKSEKTAAQENSGEAGKQAGCGWGCYVLVEDTLRALRDIAEAYRKKLAVKTVGITGSSGKTSTKEFIAGVLGEKYSVLKTEGNFNNEIGVPLTLLRIRSEHEIAVVEMGISDFGEMHRLSRMVRPDVCVITNIGQSHLNNLIDREGILRAKSEIFDFMAEEGRICLNAEDDILSGLGEIKGRRPHFFGLGDNAQAEVLMADIEGKGLLGSEAVLVMRGSARETRISVRIPLPGEHMVLNAAAAACVANLLGLTGEEIAAGMAGVSAVSGRTNIIRTSRNTIIDDCYNANPASVKAAVELLAMADTEKAAILGDMLNLGSESDRYHGEIGVLAAKLGIDRIVCVGEESRHMYREARAHAGDRMETFWFPDTESLLEALRGERESLAPEGSSVLVKASHDLHFADVVKFLREETPDKSL